MAGLHLIKYLGRNQYESVSQIWVLYNFVNCKTTWNVLIGHRNLAGNMRELS